MPAGSKGVICEEPDTIPLFPVIVAKVIVPPNAVDVPAIVIVLFVIPVPLICAEPDTNVVPVAKNVPFTCVLEPNVIKVPVSLIFESFKCSLPVPFGTL